ncbi:MAG: formate dehydrogenase accessory sulfurtransferase FdhD [Luteimonas sp.]
MPADPPRTPTPPRGSAGRDVERVRGTARDAVADHVAEEVPVALRIDGTPFAVMMATPCDLEDFALGFALTEGLVDAPAQLAGVSVEPLLEGIELALALSAEAPGVRAGDAAARRLPGRSGCGLCGTRELEDAVRAPPPVRDARRFRLDALERAFAALPAQQPMNAATGAVHAAAWADAAGRIVLVREDVGRHNALDKLVGALVRAGHAPGEGMLLLTSRASYEMVAKAARAGIGFIAAISAPTALAVDLARGANVCLVGFARPGGCNVYAHPQRLLASP